MVWSTSAAASEILWCFMSSSPATSVGSLLPSLADSNRESTWLTNELVVPRLF